MPARHRAKLSAAFGAKYGEKGYHPNAEQYQQADSGLYAVRPRVAFAWGDFVMDAARRTFYSASAMAAAVAVCGSVPNRLAMPRIPRRTMGII